jgi:hypothetical protein
MIEMDVGNQGDIYLAFDPGNRLCRRLIEHRHPDNLAPARSSFFIWRAVAATSAVSVVVID